MMMGGNGGKLEGKMGKAFCGVGEGLLGAALQGAVVVVLVTLLLFASCRHESVSSFNLHFCSYSNPTPLSLALCSSLSV